MSYKWVCEKHGEIPHWKVWKFTNVPLDRFCIDCVRDLMDTFVGKVSKIEVEEDNNPKEM